MALDRLGSVAVDDLPAVLQFVLVHADSQLPQVRSLSVLVNASSYQHVYLLLWHCVRWCSWHARRSILPWAPIHACQVALVCLPGHNQL